MMVSISALVDLAVVVVVVVMVMVVGVAVLMVAVGSFRSLHFSRCLFRSANETIHYVVRRP